MNTAQFYISRADRISHLNAAQFYISRMDQFFYVNAAQFSLSTMDWFFYMQPNPMPHRIFSQVLWLQLRDPTIDGSCDVHGDIPCLFQATTSICLQNMSPERSNHLLSAVRVLLLLLLLLNLPRNIEGRVRFCMCHCSRASA